MTTKFAAAPKILLDPDFEVLPDPPKKRDMLQEEDATYARGATRARFEELQEDETEEEAVVRAEGYLRLSMETRSSFDWLLYPDLMVAFGVDPDLIDARNGYVIEDHGKPPALAMEIASKTTGRRDIRKRVGYAALGVREYLMFDRTGGQYHDAPVWGGRLANGRYEPIPVFTDENGVHSVYSETLRLDVCWVDGKLRFRDPIHGEFLHTHAEAISAAELQTILREAAEDRAVAAETARQEAEYRADAAEDRAITAETALQAAETARQAAEAARREAEVARQANLERAQAAEAARQAKLERAQAAEAENEKLRRQIRAMRQDREGADCS